MHVLVMRPNRKFPHLSSYLQKVGEAASRANVQAVPPWAWVFAIAALTIGLAVKASAVLLTLVPLAVIVLLVASAVRRSQLAADPQYSRKMEVFRVAAELRALEGNRRLHRWMDPVALQLLEAAAFHWTRVHTTLTGPQWGARDLPAYWRNLRVQIEEASDQGMADLLLLTRNCIGPPQKDRESEIKGVFESFVDLEIADALQGLKNMAKADWTAYAHQSPQSQAVAHYGRTIAERLQALADDVEAKASEITIESAGGNMQSLQALDGVLGELRTVRQAEQELEDRIRS